MSVDFEQGCHVICAENGWGKSTLAAFIRVMLFG
ncbi:MAG: ATP-binding protein, partial [Clostridiales bacterium]|nr:ATP-binding protein [Clostridiales bacterium]